MQISNLRDVSQFADTIADRGWHAWWTDSGVPLSDYRKHLDPMMTGKGIPFALVAHDGETYLGSALVIESDLEARPQLAPWIAALWVDEAARRKGIAAQLMHHAQNEIAKLGTSTCYLCATLENSPYYSARGFTLIEESVTGLNVFKIATHQK